MKKQKFLINVDQRFREFYMICSAMRKNYRFAHLGKQRRRTNYVLLAVWQCGLWSSQIGGTKLERFLPLFSFLSVQHSVLN